MQKQIVNMIISHTCSSVNFITLYKRLQNVRECFGNILYFLRSGVCISYDECVLDLGKFEVFLSHFNRKWSLRISDKDGKLTAAPDNSI